MSTGCNVKIDKQKSLWNRVGWPEGGSSCALQQKQSPAGRRKTSFLARAQPVKSLDSLFTMALPISFFSQKKKCFSSLAVRDSIWLAMVANPSLQLSTDLVYTQLCWRSIWQCVLVEHFDGLYRNQRPPSPSSFGASEQICALPTIEPIVVHCFSHQPSTLKVFLSPWSNLSVFEAI